MSVLHRIRTADVALATAVTGHTADGGDAAGCAACPHPLDFHDRIAARYCTATIAGLFSRGCVCTAYPDKKST